MGLTRRTHNSKLFMSKSVSTHLTMADSMIFIAAIALGLWGCRLFLLGPTPIPSPFEHFIGYSHMQSIFMTAVLVMSLTIALIAIPIATFRYRLRRDRRQLHFPTATITFPHRRVPLFRLLS